MSRRPTGKPARPTFPTEAFASRPPAAKPRLDGMLFRHRRGSGAVRGAAAAAAAAPAAAPAGPWGQPALAEIRAAVFLAPAGRLRLLRLPLPWVELTAGLGVLLLILA